MIDDENRRMNDLLIWVGIALCLMQSGLFSGLNLAVFSLSRLHLEAAAGKADADGAYRLGAATRRQPYAGHHPVK
ncbi:MAG: hypothetical protein Q8K74_09640 [Candidatus Nitrotoga sp.]|nr:hypothetical protein [Candidatus Nitrotoga sp.]MDP1856291.1 hypothetical protein [Candidatus Nitrotoga sp.]